MILSTTLSIGLIQSDFLNGMLVGTGLGALFGSMLTYFLGFKRVRKPDGHTVLVPVVDNRPLAERIHLREWSWNSARRWVQKQWVLLLLVVMLASSYAYLMAVSFESRRFADHQVDCNEEFRQSSKVLREIAAKDRELEARDDKLRDQRDTADADWIGALLKLSPGSRDESIRLTIAYQETLHQIANERAGLNVERAQLETERRQQPDPTEGC